jgi:hypothetical protein
VVEEGQGSLAKLLKALAWSEEVSSGRSMAGAHGGCRIWEKRSLRAISRWFDLDDVVAPSADEGRAIGPHGR